MPQQNVVITGSTQGLGLGYAREFLRLGHNVVVSGRDPARVDAAVARLAAEAPPGARVLGVAADVASMAAVYKGMTGLTPQMMAEDIGVPFHPGAAKFYAENSITVKAR